MAASAIGIDDVLEYLGRLGVLLETDRAFPSLTGLIVREPIKGSWWSHPMASEIYLLSRRLTHHGDAICLKLLSGKSTYVHRRWWPELLAICTAHEPWQVQGLAASAKSMLKKVEASGRLRMDEFKSALNTKAKGAIARTLESRLLVYSEDVHTESGAHTKRIETWEHWAWRSGFQIQVLPPPERAKEKFSELVANLNMQFDADAKLPWQHKKIGSRARVKA